MARKEWASCDWCHEEIEDQDSDEFWEKFYAAGWKVVTVGMGDEEVKDFCSNECMVSFFDGEG